MLPRCRPSLLVIVVLLAPGCGRYGLGAAPSDGGADDGDLSIDGDGDGPDADGEGLPSERDWTIGADEPPLWESCQLSAVSPSSTGSALLAFREDVVAAGTLPSARAFSSAAQAPNGLFYVFGGSPTLDDRGQLDEIVEYDPETGATVAVGALPEGMSWLHAVSSAEGAIFLFNGFDGSLETDQAWRFDVDALELVEAGTIPPAYRRSVALGADGNIYLFGGVLTGPIEDSIVRYDPRTETSTTLAVTMPTARDCMAALPWSDGNIYVFGGSEERHGDNAPLTSGIVTDEVLAFSPALETIEVVAHLPAPVMNAVAFPAPSGDSIVIMGGHPDTGYTGDATDAEFFPDTGEVVAAAPRGAAAGLSGASIARGLARPLFLFGGARPDGGWAVTDQILQVFPYETTGVVVSPVLAVEGPRATFLRLEWEAELPPGTAIALEVRTTDETFASDDESPPWQPLSDDAGDGVAEINRQGRYAQWRATLSGSPVTSPELHRVALWYEN